MNFSLVPAILTIATVHASMSRELGAPHEKLSDDLREILSQIGKENSSIDQKYCMKLAWLRYHVVRLQDRELPEDAELPEDEVLTRHVHWQFGKKWLSNKLKQFSKKHDVEGTYGGQQLLKAIQDFMKSTGEKDPTLSWFGVCKNIYGGSCKGSYCIPVFQSGPGMTRWATRCDTCMGRLFQRDWDKLLHGNYITENLQTILGWSKKRRLSRTQSLMQQRSQHNEQKSNESLSPIEEEAADDALPKDSKTDGHTDKPRDSISMPPPTPGFSAAAPEGHKMTDLNEEPILGRPKTLTKQVSGTPESKKQLCDGKNAPETSKLHTIKAMFASMAEEQRKLDEKKAEEKQRLRENKKRDISDQRFEYWKQGGLADLEKATTHKVSSEPSSPSCDK